MRARVRRVRLTVTLFVRELVGADNVVAAAAVSHDNVVC